MAALRDVVLERSAGRIVIFVDEIDLVQSLPFSADEFFAGIRECYNRRSEEPELAQLTFCLLRVGSPSDLIRDTRITPFNIGRRKMAAWGARRRVATSGCLLPYWVAAAIVALRGRTPAAADHSGR